MATLGTAYAEPTKPEAARAAINKATAAIKAGNPAGVIPLVDPVITTLEEMEKEQTVNCADSTAEALMLSLSQAAAMDKTPAKERRNAGVVAPDFCAALFLKGFALIDLMRMEEAEVFLRRAHETAPLSAQYLNEYAQWHASARQWNKAHDLFQEAFDLGEWDADKNRKKFNQARALRGMAFSEIEMGELGSGPINPAFEAPEWRTYRTDRCAGKAGCLSKNRTTIPAPIRLAPCHFASNLEGGINRS
ncbi:MAG: hypothetical protein B7Y89_12190 [Novosphingobium sp. 32-60-15]|uniref:tetratricopeptide repeat protein n=1 Tax=Novosphingobium sp. 32-60-15 TaxID=1970410 RepID=UPI000BCA79E3|nr:tetratricopeptide repeat protein [Novosphingobium sp. 32-60-15]OYX61673.1 MAG: hypothetical protein B7Y89_12190 [Novosphingobium sp. 32-60-15]